MLRTRRRCRDRGVFVADLELLSHLEQIFPADFYPQRTDVLVGKFALGAPVLLRIHASRVPRLVAIWSFCLIFGRVGSLACQAAGCGDSDDG